MLPAEADEWHWLSIDETVSYPMIPCKEKERLLFASDLCLTGEVG